MSLTCFVKFSRLHGGPRATVCPCKSFHRRTRRCDLILFDSEAGDDDEVGTGDLGITDRGETLTNL